jgi:cysteine desulfurase
MIYLDYAATTPMSEQALKAYTNTASLFFGNPSSLHDAGTKADELLALCRKQFAQFINGQEQGVYFTSGGTEANNLAIRSLLRGCSPAKRHIITTSVEHSSILHLFDQLGKEGFTVTYLPVDVQGKVLVSTLQDAILPETVLVSIQHVNHEIGTIQPIKEIGRYLKEQHILFHCDCVQSFGKLPIDVQAAGIDSLSVSSHKIYGPKGMGAVYIDPAVPWKPVYPNTSHQNGFRPGTIDVPGVVSFITAAQETYAGMEKQRQMHEQLKAQWLNLLEPLKSVITVEGAEESIPSVIGMTIRRIQGQYVMLECNRHGISISTGSACQAGLQQPPAVMTAIGKTEEEAKQFIRISFGKNTSYNELNQLFHVVKEMIEEFHCLTEQGV